MQKVGIPIYFPDSENFQMQDDVMNKRLRTTGYAGDKLSELVLKLLEHNILGNTPGVYITLNGDIRPGLHHHYYKSGC